jgi:glycosyltransferase involved in cell wall biosynthesis
LAHARIALFIGSWHQPNIEAVEKIFEMAVKLPQVNFLIMGSVGLYFKDQATPKNVGFLGVVDNEEKDLILGIVDVALNPMLSGSGINLKLLDYLAAGIPVITTQFGIRGLNIPDGLADVCDLNEFPNRIYQNIDENKIRMARKFVEEKFSWKEVCKKLECFYRNHLGH